MTRDEIDVQLAIARLYDGQDLCTRDTGNVGGHCHIILDDGNVEDGDVDFCFKEATGEKCSVCAAIAATLALIPAERREKLYEAGWGRRAF